MDWSKKSLPLLQYKCHQEGSSKLRPPARLQLELNATEELESGTNKLRK